MPSSSASFFHIKRSFSEIKAELLPAFFKIWEETTAAEELMVADLNAGTGSEATGEKPTVLKVLESYAAAENGTENAPKTLTLFLGDAAKTKLEKLKQNLQNTDAGEPRLPENILLLNEPESRTTLSTFLQKVPGLVVAYPFSYSLAQEIISEAIQNTDSSLFLIFDFKKLETSFLAQNPTVLISSIFGADLGSLQDRLQAEKSLKRREQLLMESLESRFYEAGLFPLRFKINPPGKTGSTTYLLLAGSNQQTYFRTKEWLQTYSEFQEDGVPLFGANLNYQPAAIPGFSDFLNRFSLQNLMQELAGQKADFHYQTIREIYEAHSPGTPYLFTNYVAALKNLQAAGIVNLVDQHNKKVKLMGPGTVVFYRLHR